MQPTVPILCRCVCGRLVTQPEKCEPQILLRPVAVLRDELRCSIIYSFDIMPLKTVPTRSRCDRFHGRKKYTSSFRKLAGRNRSMGNINGCVFHNRENKKQLHCHSLLWSSMLSSLDATALFFPLIHNQLSSQLFLFLRHG